MDALSRIIWGLIGIGLILTITWMFLLHKKWEKPAETVEKVIDSVFRAIP